MIIRQIYRKELKLIFIYFYFEVLFNNVRKFYLADNLILKDILLISNRNYLFNYII